MGEKWALSALRCGTTSPSTSRGRSHHAGRAGNTWQKSRDARGICSFLPGNGTQSIVVMRALPIATWYYLWLGVRVHNHVADCWATLCRAERRFAGPPAVNMRRQCEDCDEAAVREDVHPHDSRWNPTETAWHRDGFAVEQRCDFDDLRVERRAEEDVIVERWVPDGDEPGACNEGDARRSSPSPEDKLAVLACDERVTVELEKRPATAPEGACWRRLPRNHWLRGPRVNSREPGGKS
jgi:hypothetical protein